MAGCLPMLVQIPRCSSRCTGAVRHHRNAPGAFLWLDQDLSQPDPTNVFNLFGLILFDPTHIPLFGSFLWLGVWPLLMGVSMWVQMKMNPEATDPVQRQMFAWMPVIFTFMMGSFPAGLVIYWTGTTSCPSRSNGFIMKRAGVKFELWDNLVATFKAQSRPSPDRAGRTRLRRNRPQAFRGLMRIHLERRRARRTCRPRRAGIRFRRPFQRRQVVAGQRADWSQDAGPRLVYTPGRTQQLNFFDLGERARRRHAELRLRRRLQDQVRVMGNLDARLSARPRAIAARLLVDGRRGLMPPDKACFDMLDASAVSYAVVLTKKDEVKKSEIDARVAEVEAGIAKAAGGPLSRTCCSPPAAQARACRNRALRGAIAGGAWAH